MRARVRGIYATALTRLLLEADHEVVQASEAIRNRFDARFETADHDVSIDTTADRQGVGVEGDADAVDAVSALLGAVDIDTFVWIDDTPRGGVFDAKVGETHGAGAVCDLGDAEGYLPYDRTAQHVETGDMIRVQVVESKPPWTDDRAVLDTEIVAYAGLATLVPGSGVRVETRDDGAGRELVGMTDLLGVEIPDGWGVRWERGATDVDMETLRTALERAVERAKRLDEHRGRIDDDGDQGRVAAPTATAWVWFGRESRFALDERRRAVTTTMPGHHRTKLVSEAASAGVDLAEALCEPTGEFPFDVVTRRFGPVETDRVRIEHGKPDGRLVVLGRGEVVEHDPDGTVAVRREMTPGGEYDGLGVRRQAGDVAHTKFREGRWWYPTVYRGDGGDLRGTYVNICTPVECLPDAVRYVDLYVDVIKHADGRVERVDDDELDEAVEAGLVSDRLARKARAVAASIEDAL